MKFTRQTGLDVYGRIYVMYSSVNVDAPTDVEVYVTQAGVTVDKCNYHFRADDHQGMGDLIAVLRAAEWHSKCLRINGALSTDTEPACVEIVAEGDASQ